MSPLPQTHVQLRTSTRWCPRILWFIHQGPSWSHHGPPSQQTSFLPSSGNSPADMRHHQILLLVRGRPSTSSLPPEVTRSLATKVASNQSQGLKPPLTGKTHHLLPHGRARHVNPHGCPAHPLSHAQHPHSLCHIHPLHLIRLTLGLVHL